MSLHGPLPGPACSWVRSTLYLTIREESQLRKRFPKLIPTSCSAQASECGERMWGWQGHPLGRLLPSLRRGTDSKCCQHRVDREAPGIGAQKRAERTPTGQGWPARHLPGTAFRVPEVSLQRILQAELPANGRPTLCAGGWHPGQCWVVLGQVRGVPRARGPQNLGLQVCYCQNNAGSARSQSAALPQASSRLGGIGLVLALFLTSGHL
uniref:Uncharacterized protein n=1 Tax=Myotis myotis TaxID=51298 RepID=A0A7J7R0A3_MYOMY|nr:hypothetical protein mMyoMyo1_011252 [Myotis myotis]